MTAAGAMVDVSKAVSLAKTAFPYNAGAFYGSAAGLDLGIGLIYEGVKYPLYNSQTQLFDTVEGMAYVLTHECDVDQSNSRHFNELVLVCPIILFDAFAVEFTSAYSEHALHGILPDIASDKVFRVFYLPPHSVSGLEFGGLVFLNQICSTHVGEFANAQAKPLCALSDYAQGIVDRKLQNHLLRPKAQALPRLN